jgi:hypothetical protein
MAKPHDAYNNRAALNVQGCTYVFGGLSNSYDPLRAAPAIGADLGLNFGKRESKPLLLGL